MTDVIVGFDVRACVHADVEHGHITRVAIDPLSNDQPRHLGGRRDRLEAAIALCEEPATAWPQSQRVARLAQPAITRLADQHAFLVEGNTWSDRFGGVCDGRGHTQLGRVLMDPCAQLAHRTASTR